jgi:Fe-S-cluster containining protein
MEIELKLQALDRIYGVWANFAEPLETACRKHCSHCCTCNVTLTTLEGCRIIAGLGHEAAERFRDVLAREHNHLKFKPKITINQMATLCSSGLELPDGVPSSAAAPCPLLTDRACPVYGLRPFACRSFVSRTTCTPGGAADVEPFVLSVNTVFLQVIEHLDAAGCSGNLTDVLLCLLDNETEHAYRDGRLHCSRVGLIPNQPLSVLMVPPEHRLRLEPILNALRNIRL